MTDEKTPEGKILLPVGDAPIGGPAKTEPMTETKVEPKTQPEPSPGERLNSFFEWIKPYQKLLILAVAVVSAVSGGVAWVTAYFATQAAVSQLECRLTHQMNSSRFEEQAAIYQTQVDTRQSQIKQMQFQNQKGQATGQALSKLVDEINDFTAKAKNERDKASDEMKAAVNCPVVK